MPCLHEKNDKNCKKIFSRARIRRVFPCLVDAWACIHLFHLLGAFCHQYMISYDWSSALISSLLWHHRSWFQFNKWWLVGEVGGTSIFFCFLLGSVRIDNFDTWKRKTKERLIICAYFGYMHWRIIYTSLRFADSFDPNWWWNLLWKVKKRLHQ